MRHGAALRRAVASFLAASCTAWGVVPAYSASLPATASPHAMVVTAQHLATDVGLAILRQGGNAVDAAVAIGYAEAVVNPCCGNIGGGGFMLLHLRGHGETVIDFRETAPARASAGMYLDAAGNLVPEASTLGYKAVAIPGTVLGLDTALKKYGTLPHAAVIAPAIRLARQGFVLTQADADILDAQIDHIRKDPQLRGIFLRPDGSSLRAGDRLVQADLARTLAGISKQGPDYFYRGPVARSVVAASQASGGILSIADFASYHADVAKPLSCTYRGYTIVSVAPPSSGGVALCEMLNILEGYDLKSLGFHSAAATRLMVEAMRYAFADRNDSLGDPAFVDNPLNKLLSKDYAAAIRSKIARGIAPQQVAVSREKPQTTHYSVLDKDGNAASVTYTLNGSLGALVAAPGTGVLLNDEMDDFTAKPGAANQFGLIQGSKNAIAPGKRPLSSMSPTIVLKDGKPFLVLGSPGGSRIITATLEALINVVDYGMEPQAAVDAPRFHYQGLPDKIFAEPLAFSPDTRALLEAAGYQFEEQSPWSAVELIRAGDAILSGANDARRPAGSARGY